ncbi:MAG: hypothetical protein LBN22_08470 [Clostridiales Family XIII bacterium]|jgi:hypothetical protein|nr:hypothetical protein [Clostridiales Family XIII bacterium]
MNFRALLSMIISLALLTANVATFAASGLKFTVPDNKTLTYTYGQAQNFVLNVKNTSKSEITGIKISPQIPKSYEDWPFQIEYQDYQKTIKSLKPGASQQVSFPFTLREGVPTYSYPITFHYTTAQGADDTKQFYVNTVAQSAAPSPAPAPADPSVPQPAPPSEPADTDPDGTEPDEPNELAEPETPEPAELEQGATSANARVIVTGFNTTPETIMAGSNFTLVIHLRNTSTTSRVSNMLITLNPPAADSEGSTETEAPVFLPASGSNSIYLDSIAAGGTADVSIELNAKSDLIQKPYSVDLAIAYDDGGSAQHEETSSLSIPVKQEVRFEISDFEISPMVAEAGSEVNVMCSVYNTGKVRLYNVKAKLSGEAITCPEIYLGNIAPGDNAAIDAMPLVSDAANGVTDVSMVLSYEDEAGTATLATKDFELEVQAPEEQMFTDEAMDNERGHSFLVPAIIIGVVVIAAGAVAFVLIRRKKRKVIDDEEAFFDEVD